MNGGEHDDDASNDFMEIDVIVHWNHFSQNFVRSNEKNRLFEHQNNDQCTVKIQQHPADPRDDHQRMILHDDDTIDQDVQSQS